MSPAASILPTQMLSNFALIRTHNVLRILPRGYKLFSYSTQLSMKFFLHINIKMPTTIGILTFMSGKNSILGLSEHEKSRIY